MNDMNDIDWYYLENLPDSSPRLFRYLRHLACGLTVYQIALTEEVSDNTVKNSLARAQENSGAMTRAHLVSLAHQVGIL